MEQFFIPVLIGFTSAGAYLLAAARCKLSRRLLPVAVGKMLECVGLTLAFAVANVLAGILAALGARVLLSQFVPLYLAGDVTVLGLSLLQAITFQWWHQLSSSSRA